MLTIEMLVKIQAKSPIDITKVNNLITKVDKICK